jgi:hypothetical protein
MAGTVTEDLLRSLAPQVLGAYLAAATMTMSVPQQRYLHGRAARLADRR